MNKVWLEQAGSDYVMVKRLTRIFYRGRFFHYLVLSSIILLALGMAKIVGVLNGPRSLWDNEPAFDIPYAWLLSAAGACEVVLAGLCFIRGGIRAVLCVTLFAFGVLAYRAALWSVDWVKPCSCMGILSEGLGLSMEVAESVSLAIAVCMAMFGVMIVVRGRHWV